MILLFVIVCELIIFAFSAMMQPGRTKTTAARVSGQPRPQRAPDADGRTAPTRMEGTPERKPGRKQGTTRARTRRDGRRQHAEKLPTAKTGSYTQPPRAETIHGSRALDGPKTTSPKPQNPPKSTDQPRISPQKPPDPVSIFSIFRLDFPIFLDFFSIFCRLDSATVSIFLHSARRSAENFSIFPPQFSIFSTFPIAQEFPNFSNFLQFPKFCRFFSISRAPSVLPCSPFCAIIFSNKFSSFRHKSPKHPIW